MQTGKRKTRDRISHRQLNIKIEIITQIFGEPHPFNQWQLNKIFEAMDFWKETNAISSWVSYENWRRMLLELDTAIAEYEQLQSKFSRLNSTRNPSVSKSITK